MNELTVRVADLNDDQDADAVLQMTRAYSFDPMGAGKDLTDEVQTKLIDSMKAHPALVSFVAWEGNSPVGIANCLMSFSTFRARNILNIHDFSVVPNARGKGVSRKIMSAVEQHATKLDCAAITLEVNGENHHARDVYSSMGFEGSREESEGNTCYFCYKKL